MNVREVARRTLIGLLGASLILTGTAGGTVSSATQPLLMEGKKSLYQRVLAEPSARLYSRPGGTTQFTQPVSPFTIFYVYDRVNSGGTDWLRVGVDKHAGAQGWVRAGDVIEWKYIYSRIPQGFAIDQFCVWSNGVPDLIHIVSIYQVNFNPQSFEYS